MRAPVRSGECALGVRQSRRRACAPVSAEPGRRARLAAALALAAATGIAVWVYSQGGVELNPMALRARIEALGWLAPLGFMLAAALRPFLLLPSWIIMSAGGLLFGVAGGVLWGSLGFTCGALFSFGVARGLGRDVVQRRLRGRVARIDRYLRQQGPRWMALYTAIPVTPLTPVHAAAGLSGIAALSFAVSVFLGFVPRIALYSFFGDSLAQGNVRRIAIAAAVLVVAVVVGTVVVRRYFGEASGGDETEPSS